MTHKVLYNIFCLSLAPNLLPSSASASAPATLPSLLQQAGQVTEEQVGGGLIGPAFKTICISKVKERLRWGLEWTASVRNRAVSASQRSGGKVSAYIRRLETVPKSRG